MFKDCSKCSKSKFVKEFIFDKRRNSYWAECKECYNKRRSKKRVENPGIWRDIERRARYKYVYGLDIDEVPTYGVCPICTRERRLVVDHCHKEGHVRGFICYNCNTLLGHIENEDKMKRIYSYLNALQKETQT